MQNPEAKKPNRSLFYILGGCVLVFFLCAICLVATFVLAGPQVQQVFNQVQSGIGGQAQSNPVLPPPTSAPGVPTTAATRAAVPTTAAQPPSSGNPGDALLKAFTNWGSVKSFRARMSVGSGPTAAQMITLEMVQPDRMRMTSQQFEMILIGSTSYVKVGPTWQKMDLPQTVDVNQFSPKTYLTALQRLPDTKILGPDTVDGVPTIVYQFGATGAGASPATTTKVWIGAVDGFPHKIEAGGTTLTFYDFNANITINAPIP